MGGLRSIQGTHLSTMTGQPEQRVEGRGQPSQACRADLPWCPSPNLPNHLPAGARHQGPCPGGDGVCVCGGEGGVNAFQFVSQ